MGNRCRAIVAAALLAGVAGCARRHAPPSPTGASPAQVDAMRKEIARLHEHIALLEEQAALEREIGSLGTGGKLDLWDYAERMEALRAENARLRKELDEKTLVIARLADAGVPVADLVAGTGPAAAPNVHGKVLAVRPEVNLVMLSVGKDNGVTKGLRLTVYRDERYVGKVEVEKVFNDVCSARIIQDWTKGSIKEGDDAATAP